MKKILILIVTILMVFTAIPINTHIIYAEGEITPNEEQIDNEITQGEVVQEIIVDSLIAEANEELAAVKAVEAVVEEQTAEKILEKIEEKSDEALERSEEAKEASKEGLEDAREAAHDQDKEEYKEALSDTVEASFDANKAALDAKIAYDQAVITKELAIKKIDEDLKQGLISSEKAVELTKQAKDVADAYYEQMLKAQKDAEKAQQDAKQGVEDAKAELKESFEELETTVLENTAEIVQDTTVAVVTGVVYEAAKIASDIADKVVDKYEGDAEELETAIKELDDQIGVLNQEIGNLEKAVENASDAYDKSVEKAFELKKGWLESAESYKNRLNECKEEAKAILAKKKEAAYKEDMEKYQKAFNDESLDTEEKINENIKNLTETVVEHVKDIDSKNSDNMQIVWKDGTGNYFYYVDSEGNPVDKGVYYQAKVVGDDGSKYVQFFKVKENLEFNDIDTATKNSYPNPNSEPVELTSYKAFDENGNEIKLQVVIKEVKPWFGKAYIDYTYQVVIGEQTIDLRTDKKGYVYLQYNTGSDKNPNYHNIEVKMADGSMIVSEKAESTNSNTITDKWNSLSDVEAKKQRLDCAKKALEESSEFTQKVELESEKEELVEKLKEVDKKLNGNSLDKFIRGILELDEDSFAEMKDTFEKREQLLQEKEDLIAARAAIDDDSSLSNAQKIAKIFDYNGLILRKQNEINAVNLKLTVEYGKTDAFKDFITIIADPDSYKEGADNIKEVQEFTKSLQILMDKQFTADDIKAVIEMVEASSMSAKTKAAIAQRIEEFARIQHENAVENLEEAIERSNSDFKDNVKNIANKAVNLVKSEGKLIGSNINLLRTNALLCNAEKLQKFADFKYFKAEMAYNHYKDVLKCYKHELNMYVVDARNNYFETLRNANIARRNAKKAWDLYETFKNDYDVNPHPQEIKIKWSKSYVDPNALLSLLVKAVDAGTAADIATRMGFNPEDVLVIDAYIAQDGRRIEGPVETEDELSIYITLPDEFVNRPYASGTNTRLYTVTMWHDANDDGVIDDGEVEIVLTDTPANENNQLVVKSSKFSYFVISYKDVYVSNRIDTYVVPNTGVTEKDDDDNAEETIND